MNTTKHCCMPLCTQILLGFVGSLALLLILPAQAQDKQNDIHCAAVEASVAKAGFSERVSVECKDGQAIITSNTYPDHELMTGIVGTNEQVPVPAIYAAPIPLTPQLESTPQTRDAALGVAVNGVPIYDYTAGGEMTLDDLHHHQENMTPLLLNNWTTAVVTQVVAMIITIIKSLRA